MGLFLAERISGGAAYWLCGVAISASVASFAMYQPEAPAPAPRDKVIHGCKKRVVEQDNRRVLSVGPMLEAGSYRDVMRETVRTELTSRSPWRIELTEAPSGGFFVDGTVDEMRVKREGDITRVYCELKLWVRTGETPISLLSGSASVDTTHGQRDVALSRQACVPTVAEELVQRLLGGDPWE